MTDEELIKELRSIDHMKMDDCFLHSFLYSKAADRIEQLELERDALLRVVTDNHVALCRAEEAEAKLAKAVNVLRNTDEALSKISGFWFDCSPRKEILATLAELEKTK